MTKQSDPEIATEGRHRVVIENVLPSNGGFPIKRIIGEAVPVEADLFADGHALISAVVKYRHVAGKDWSEYQMIRVANDRWRGDFMVTSVGTWLYTIETWVDRFKSWRDEFKKK